MKKFSILLSSALLIANISYAQSTSTDIRESTDASKIAEIEQHAQQLASQQNSSGASSDKANSGSGMKRKHAKHKKGTAQHKSDSAGTASK